MSADTLIRAEVLRPADGSDGSDRPPQPPAPPRGAPATVPPRQGWHVDVSLILRMIAIVMLGLLLNLVFISQVQHYTAQTALYDQLRLQLAEGSAPLGQKDNDGHLVTPGTPVALLEIPQLNISEVIVEGTGSSQTATGVGHRRDTVLPGQSGATVLMGRAGAYGAAFANLSKLNPGDKFDVTTGQGRFTYEVMGSRLEGEPLPPPITSKEGRITLITAAGPAFLPNGILRVDSRLVTKPAEKPAAAIEPGSLPAAEQPMGQDTSQLIGLVLLLEVITAASVAAVWCWKSWDRTKTWIIAAPVLAALGCLLGTQVNYLLPNLL